MKREILADGVELYLGDSVGVMRGFADGQFDAVITDPPYGNGTNYLGYSDTRENLRKLVRAFMPLALRKANSVFVTCGVANMWLYPEPDWTLAWVNPAGVGSSKWGFTCWQPILAYGKDPFLQDGKGRRPDTMFQHKNEVQRNGHPCAKPVNVMRWIVWRTTRKGDTILDPFMGAGTTGVAAVQQGRKFVGIELVPEYYNIAKRSIKQALMQPVLL